MSQFGRDSSHDFLFLFLFQVMTLVDTIAPPELTMKLKKNVHEKLRIRRMKGFPSWDRCWLHRMICNILGWNKLIFFSKTCIAMQFVV